MGGTRCAMVKPRCSRFLRCRCWAATTTATTTITTTYCCCCNPHQVKGQQHAAKRTCVGRPIRVELPRLIVPLLLQQDAPQTDIRARVCRVRLQAQPHAHLRLAQQSPPLAGVLRQEGHHARQPRAVLHVRLLRLVAQQLREIRRCACMIDDKRCGGQEKQAATSNAAAAAGVCGAISCGGERSVRACRLTDLCLRLSAAASRMQSRPTTTATPVRAPKTHQAQVCVDFQQLLRSARLRRRWRFVQRLVVCF